jgi:hypothetical protein
MLWISPVFRTNAIANLPHLEEPSLFYKSHSSLKASPPLRSTRYVNATRMCCRTNAHSACTEFTKGEKSEKLTNSEMCAS